MVCPVAGRRSTPERLALVPLHTTSYGDHGSRIVFCHGLFGQGRNWTQHAKALAADHRVLLVDMPDHGRSPWSERFDFVAAADQVAELLTADDPVALVGHSMGGKTAMVLALRHPELVERLCVVDVAPVAYEHSSEFVRYIDAMLAIDLDDARRPGRGRRGPAGGGAGRRRPWLPAAEPPPRRAMTGTGSRTSSSCATRSTRSAAGRPRRSTGTPPYDGPVLWIGGSESRYVLEDYAGAMERYFPRVRRVTVKGAGHWVHSEQPKVFLEVLRRFVD